MFHVTRGIGTRKNTVNSGYFKTWSAEMAYWLGFLYADGSVSKQYNKLKIGVKCIDGYHIKNFSNAIESSYKIGAYSYGKFCYVSTSIYDSEMVDDLIKLGCIPLKSKLGINGPHTLPESLNNHFLRGYFDGDGGLSYSFAAKQYNKKKNEYGGMKCLVEFCGCKQFVEACKYKIIESGCIVGCGKGSIGFDKGNTYKLYYNGNKLPLSVLEWLYGESTPETRLLRKYTLKLKYDQIMKLEPSKRMDALKKYMVSSDWQNIVCCMNGMKVKPGSKCQWK